MLNEVKKQLHALASPQKAALLQRFFKTGPGEYAAGDIFLGLTVPNIRQVAKNFPHLPFHEITELLHSKFHEERLLALIILVNQYKKAEPETQEKIYKLYLANTKYINNWDLVDTSAGYIVGAFLADKNKSILTTLAHSQNLWEKRIAIIATFYDIMRGKPEATLHIAKILRSDEHDLIHKAVGWMLREVGKRCSEKIEEDFLKKYYRTMPRTMLRYAIERFPEKKRQGYLAGKI